MKVIMDVDVRHLPRVEGHGNIMVRVRDGKVEEARWDVVETPRYFEVMLRGKHFTTAPILSARICGICSISHALASLRATEHAMGVTIPEAARDLRLLAKHGETLQSHLLHVFFLSAPDFLGLPSVVPLLKTNPEVVDLALRLKGLANRLCEVVAGRTTHPVSLQVGGVSRIPDRSTLLGLRDELARSLKGLNESADIVESFKLPEFLRETEFVSLKGEHDYPFIGGPLVSTDGVELPEVEYRAMTNEYTEPRNTSKWCRLSRDSFAVGPLARFNNNHHLLHADAASLAERMGLRPVCHNPFMSTIARLVECVHATLEAIRLIEKLSVSDAVETMAEVRPRAGQGVGAVEAPRGILYHYLEYDDQGCVVRADCVIPTTQNNSNIQNDLISYAGQLASEPGMTDEKLELSCSMLVRSYDPCISCSVH